MRKYRGKSSEDRFRILTEAVKGSESDHWSRDQWLITQLVHEMIARSWANVDTRLLSLTIWEKVIFQAHLPLSLAQLRKKERGDLIAPTTRLFIECIEPEGLELRLRKVHWKKKPPVCRTHSEEVVIRESKRGRSANENVADLGSSSFREKGFLKKEEKKENYTRRLFTQCVFSRLRYIQRL